MRKSEYCIRHIGLTKLGERYGRLLFKLNNFIQFIDGLAAFYEKSQQQHVSIYLYNETAR